MLVDSFKLEFIGQRIINSEDNSTFQVEVLTAVHDETDARVNPSAYFQTLDPRGHLDVISAQIEAINNLPPESTPQFSLNVDPLLVEDSTIVAELRERIATATRAPALEITENRPLGDACTVNARLFELKQVGCLIELDDFGSGHAMNPRMMSEYSFDVIKLDMNLLKQAQTDGRAASIFDIVVDMIRSLDKEIIVEGVETPECRLFLQERGVAIHQGYYYGKPEPLSAWGEK